MQTRQSTPANSLHVKFQLHFPLLQVFTIPHKKEKTKQKKNKDKPTANRPQENHLPLRQQHLLRREIDHLHPIPGHIEHAPIPRDDGHEKQHPRQIPQIRDRPIDRQIPQSDPPMQERRTHEHHIRREQVRAREHNHGQSDGEEDRADGPDQTGRVLLVPGGCRGGEKDGAAEAEKGASHAGVEPELVEAHVGFFGADAGDQLGGLLGGEGVHWIVDLLLMGDETGRGASGSAPLW